MRKQKSRTLLEQFAVAVAAVREELQTRGVGSIVVRSGGKEHCNNQVGVFGVDTEAIDVALPLRLQRVIDAVLKTGGSEVAHEYLIDVEAKITHVSLHLPQAEQNPTSPVNEDSTLKDHGRYGVEKRLTEHRPVS